MDCLNKNKIKSDDPILNQWKPPLKKGATWGGGIGGVRLGSHDSWI